MKELARLDTCTGRMNVLRRSHVVDLSEFSPGANLESRGGVRLLACATRKWLVCGFRFCVCMVGGLAVFTSIAQSQSAEPSAHTLVLPMAGLPSDAMRVVASMELAARGQIPAPAVIDFSSALVSRLAEPKFRYQGFSLSSVHIDEFRPVDRVRGVRALGGILRLADMFGRRAHVAFRAEYQTTGKNVKVRAAALLPLFEEKPRTTAFFVPKESLTVSKLGTWGDPALIMPDVLEKAVPLAERRQIPRGERDYYVVVLFLDRTAPASVSKLLVSRDRGAGGSQPTGHKLLVYEGWRILIAEGRFDLRGPKEIFYKVVFAPASPGTEAGEPVVLNTVSTRR